MPTESIEASEDILNDALQFLGGKPVVDDQLISYGSLNLTLPPKEGKANTLLADHLFSPSLLLAEQIERGLIPLHRKTVVELGSGCSLPSLAACTISQSSNMPSLVLTTDYPDPLILNNLKRNVERNQPLVSSACQLHSQGYEWGQDPKELLSFLSTLPPAPDTSTPERGFGIVILSDLLHFHASHDALITSVTSLLARNSEARIYVAAGKYTIPSVCNSFLERAATAGLLFDEQQETTDSSKWLGTLPVSNLDSEALGVRKGNCRFWVGRWKEEETTRSRFIG